jgi:hypothetical protein
MAGATSSWQNSESFEMAKYESVRYSRPFVSILSRGEYLEYFWDSARPCSGGACVWLIGMGLCWRFLAYNISMPMPASGPQSTLSMVVCSSSSSVRRPSLPVFVGRLYDYSAFGVLAGLFLSLARRRIQRAILPGY